MPTPVARFKRRMVSPAAVTVIAAVCIGVTFAVSSLIVRDDATKNAGRQVAEAKATFQHDQTVRLREGCERRRIADRRGALSWKAHRDYLLAVLDAASVKGDVKRAASIALRTHRKTVRVLMRFADIDCAAKYPLPGETPVPTPAQ